MTAGFEAMRLDGEKLMPQVAPMFVEGARRFFNKGTNRRWEGVFSEDDLALYQEKVRAKLDPTAHAGWSLAGRALLAWVEGSGREEEFSERG